MAFVLETGAGTPDANAYVSEAFALAYLTNRGRALENTWSGIGTVLRSAAIVKATAYLDSRFGRRFKGVRLRRSIVGRAAKGVITFSAVAADADTIQVGAVIYRFVDTLATENDVLRGLTAATSIANLRTAINTGGSDGNVEDDTRPNFEVVAGDPLDGTTLNVTAQGKGTNGNSIGLVATGGVITVSAATLAGGLDESQQPLEWPRESAFYRDGTRVVGLPAGIMEATVEYAVRSVAADLAPDPTVDPSGAPIQRLAEKVGPIATDTTFVSGAVATLRPYPIADALLEELLVSSGGVIR